MRLLINDSLRLERGDADVLLRNGGISFCTNPNAWLFGVIFDQGIPYEKAWAAPYILKRRFGTST